MLGIMLSITAGVICLCLLVEPIKVSSRKKKQFQNKQKLKVLQTNAPQVEVLNPYP